MTNDKKVRSLGFLAAFFLVTNIIMLVFFLGINDSRKTLHLKDSPISSFLKKDMGFDSRQMDAYQLLRKQDMDSMRPLFNSLRLTKDSFYQLVSKQVSDSDVINNSQEIGIRQTKVDQQMLWHFKKIRSLCTSEQLPRFDSLFKNVIGKITSGRMRKNYKQE